MISNSIRSISAWVLVLLVALPFTAPFSSCDISMLMGATSHQRARVWLSSASSTTSIEAAGSESDSGSVLQEELLKDAIVTPAFTGIVTERPVGAIDRVEPRSKVTRHPLVALRL